MDEPQITPHSIWRTKAERGLYRIKVLRVGSQLVAFGFLDGEHRLPNDVIGRERFLEQFEPVP